MSLALAGAVLIGCTSSIPLVKQTERTWDDKQIKDKLGAFHFTVIPMQSREYYKEIQNQTIIITQDKGLSEAEKNKQLAFLKKQNYQEGQCWLVITTYMKKPVRGDINLDMVDNKGKRMIARMTGYTTKLNMTTKTGGVTKKSLIYVERVLLWTSVPVTKKHITQDRSPLYFFLTLFKSNRIRYQIDPQ